MDPIWMKKRPPMSKVAKPSKKSTKRAESKTSKRAPTGNGARVGIWTTDGDPPREAGMRSDPATAFLPDPYDRRGAPARAGDPLAESLAEDYIASATS